MFLNIIPSGKESQHSNTGVEWDGPSEEGVKEQRIDLAPRTLCDAGRVPWRPDTSDALFVNEDHSRAPAELSSEQNTR